VYVVRSFEWDMENFYFKCKNVLLNNFEIENLSKYYKIEPNISRIYNPKLPNMGFIAMEFNWFLL
jgi:hypothetical protein